MSNLPGYVQWAIIIGVGLVIYLLLRGRPRSPRPPTTPGPYRNIPNARPAVKDMRLTPAHGRARFVAYIAMGEQDWFGSKYWVCGDVHSDFASALECARRQYQTGSWDGRYISD